MPFLTIGVEHTTTPLPVREAAVLDVDGKAGAGRDLLHDAVAAEVVILSTCNRTEYYIYTDQPRLARVAAESHIVTRAPLAHAFVQTWDDEASVEHLFRVASGLESQILGETQILSQVASALEDAQMAGTAGPHLHALFRAAVSCARQARAGTTIGRINPSIASEAVREASGLFGSLQGRSSLVIGAGEISRLVAEELRAADVSMLLIANRTESAARALADRMGGSPVPFREIPSILRRIDVVFSATSAPHYVLSAEDVSPRPSESLHIFDLAIPRDIDPATAEISGVVVHDLDSLLPPEVVESQRADVREMERIIRGEVQEFMSWFLARRAVPIIASLRSHVEAVQAQELRRVAPQLRDLTDRERAAVDSLTNRLVDKMFHHLVIRLRLAAQTDPKLVEAAEFFFLHGEHGLFAHGADGAAVEAPPLEQATGNTGGQEG